VLGGHQPERCSGPGGIIEAQRTSYLTTGRSRRSRSSRTTATTLYMADRYHDDVIEMEPRYAIRKPDGGWGEFAADLEVVPIGGEHIQAIDEPFIAKVGAHLAEVLNKVTGKPVRQVR